MKTSWLTIALLVLTVIRTQGQASQPDASASAGQGTIQAQDTPYAVVDRGANHRVWQRTTYETTPDGRQVPHIHKYNELATGMCFQQNGQWVDSKEEIDILPSGTGAATQGQHRAYFPGDIYQGVVELVTPDGIHLRSRPLGLSYADGSHTVLIAELKDSVGQLVGPNQVIYPDAFTDFKADLRYTYTKAGFEQDIVLREQPPVPEAYGLQSQTARLQVLTEFIGASDPVQTVGVINQQDGLQDTTLSFGQMKMIQGKAFSIADSAQTKGVFVAKSWQHLEGRTFLVEELPVQKIEPQLEQLPVPAKSDTAVNSPVSVRHKVSVGRLLPPVRLVQASTNAVQLAKAGLQQKRGVVLDYVTVNPGETNYIFHGDTTYYVSGSCGLSGTTTLEGGAVLKYDGNGCLEIDGNGAITCKTGPYRPAVFTSFNDDSVGEPIADSSGSPGFYDVNTFLNINCPNPVLRNLRFGYGYTCVTGWNYGNDSGSLDAWDCQFINVDIAIEVDNCNVGLHNVLIEEVNNDPPIWVEDSGDLIAENVTSEGYVTLSDSGEEFETNCLLTEELWAGSQWVSVNGGTWTNSPIPIFQIVGSGSYYLAPNSLYRGAGTTNINPTLLAELRQKTTYPPIVYSNTNISMAKTFSPQAQRDTNAADMGYHYDPIDYAFGGVHAASNLTFTAGTVVGWFELPGSGNTGYGISLPKSAKVTYNGTVTSPCVQARYSTVQEGGNGNWTNKGWLGGIVGDGNAPGDATVASEVDASFTRFAELANDPNNVRDYTSCFILRANNCEFWSSDQGGYGMWLCLTNCLFDRTYVGLQSGSCSPLTCALMAIRNCTFHGGLVLTTHWGDWPAAIIDSAFDGTDLSQMDASDTYCDHNAFLTNANRLPMHGAHDVTNIISFNWQSNWLGNFYLPTNSPLVNTGSVRADIVGLYHFTTQTNQVKETNSPVDIGYHYVAVDANGNPLDTDGDGLPDYVEDANGNGQVDPAETDWTNPDSDYDGVSDGQEIMDDTNPLNPDSVLQVRLGYWRFDNTNTWMGDAGQLPLLATNVVGVSSWNTNAVLIDSANAAILKYRDVETNGHANVNLRQGTIRFWFKPDWSSGDLNGTGPQTMARLIEMGNYNPAFTNGWWALYLSPDGTQLTFGSSTNGAGNTNLSTGVSWAYKRWHQIALTYSPTNAVLYCDGQVAATDDTGPNYYPSRIERTNGFRIGGDAFGGSQADGVFEDLKTFNYQLSATDIADDYNNVANSMPVPPTVTITNLTNSTTTFVGADQTLTIKVNAQAASGHSVRSVEFGYSVYRATDPPIGIATEWPFSITWLNPDWTNAFLGAYDITAVAVDDTGTASDPAVASDITVALDSDSDGIPDWWMIQYFGYPIGKAGDHTLAGDDADGDGFSNLQEYKNQTDPTDYYNGQVPNIEILSGNNQGGNYDSFLPLPVTIQVTKPNANNSIVTGRNGSTALGKATGSVLLTSQASFDVPENVLTNAPVVFTVTNGTALLALTTSNTPTNTLALRTDSNGQASVWVYFPPAGTNPPDSTISISASSGTVIANEYVLLAHWRFDDTNTWIGEAGQLPLLTNNLAGVPSWSSNAVQIDSTSPALLTYRVVETNGNTNINCETGSVLFYFKPDWNSGDGPGTWAPLIEMGNYNPAFTNGWWSLYLSPDGTQLFFATSTNGAGDVNLSADISWTSNTWYQITLAYSPTGSTLFVDGKLAAAGDGVVDCLNADELANGFRIGSDENGNNQARGAFDELETFASPLSGIGDPVDTYWLGIPDYQADPNGTLGAWEMAYFGHTGVDPYGDYDNDGTNNLQEFVNGSDPNKISFSFSVPNQYVTTNVVIGVITILGGVPSSIAVLVDSTNFTGATNWTAYTSSNITVNLGSSEVPHDIWIGLRGRLTNSYPTWEETTLVLNSISPVISITSPLDNASFNSARVNVSGNFTAGTLKQITVNGILAFVNGANFEALNVPLDAGVNTITAIVEDLTGMTNAVSITVTGTTNADGSMNNPVQLQATPVAGFAPLPVTFQVQTNMPGTVQQVLYDFNGDDIADFVTNSLDSITYTYATNGEYFPVVTIQTDAGRFSSIGGWNAVWLDPSNQPIRINVQAAVTQTLFATVTDPVDLKWTGNNLYVLSGSTATITEFDTNATPVNSLGNLGTNPTGFDVDGAGNIYVAVTSSNQVWRFMPTNSSYVADTNFGFGGFIGITNGISGTNNGEFNAPFDVAVSPGGGTISVSDSGNNRIQQFSAANGSFIASFGSQGSDVGQFNTPKGLTYDALGTLYIVDSGNNRIALGKDSVTGAAGTDLGQFQNPTNISVGKRGVYVADTGNGRIQKFDLPGQGLFSITPLSIGYAVSTNLSQPTAVAAVDDLITEKFYVADTGHGQVLLCTLAPDDPTPAWTNMTACVTNGDFFGATRYFSTKTADDYHQDFLAVGAASLISAINQIGTLTPVSIEKGTAEYYFEQTIGGQTITFPVEFIKEEGGWKILEF